MSTMESEIPVDIYSSLFICMIHIPSYVIILLCLHCSCWMSIEEGTIFGFVAPILAIILVSGQACNGSPLFVMHNVIIIDKCCLYGSGSANSMESGKRSIPEGETKQISSLTKARKVITQ